MFGDNKSVVTSSTIPHSKLNKHHSALSYHRVREAIAAKIIDFLYIDGKTNPANVLSSIADTSTHGHISSGYSSGKDHHLNKLMVFRVEKGRRKSKSPIKWFLFRILWGPCNREARGHFKHK